MAARGPGLQPPLELATVTNREPRDQRSHDQADRDRAAEAEEVGQHRVEVGG